MPPSFQESFVKSKGAAIKYNNLELVNTDRIPVKKKFSGTIRLISTNSEWKQAVCLRVLSGKLIIGSDNSDEGKLFCLWEDYLFDNVYHFEGTTKDLQLLVYNAWAQIDWIGKSFTNYWQHGAAMIVEINGNTRRYRCNDGHPDENFDDIIFEVTIDD